MCEEVSNRYPFGNQTATGAYSPLVRESTLREKLEKELASLNKRQDKIVEILKELTPEIETSIRILEKVSHLGLYGG